MNAYAHEGTITYEKYHRLNPQSYRSNTGDWIGLSYEDNTPKARLDTYLSGDFRLYFQDNNSFNYSIQEAYVRYRADTYRIYLGRKILDWNQNEKYWALGYLNALQAFTLLSTEEEGLMGLHVEKDLGNFEFDFLLSYLFIPQLNPSIQIKNGVVTSHSEWTRLPPKYALISGKVEPIYYKIDPYSTSNIIFNKSIGSNLKYKWGKGGVSFFAIYKPENVLRSNAVAYYDNITLKQPVVEASPTVNHHLNTGVELNHTFGEIVGRGGISYVNPNANLGKDFPIPITNSRQSQPYDQTGVVINPRYEKEAYSHFSVNLDRDKYALSLNYIHLLTNDHRINDDFSSDAVKWKRAIGGSFIYYFSDDFSVSGDLKYDLARYDNILKGEIKYNYLHRINISIGVELLKSPTDTSYWSYYRADSSLYTALGFYF